MPLSSYRVLSENKYIGQPSVKDSPKVASKDIKSNQGMAIDRESTQGGQPTVGSYGHAAPTVILTKDGVGNNTSNNRFLNRDWKENGYASPQIDDGIIRGAYQFPSLGAWKSAGEDNYSSRHNLIPKNPDFALIVSPRLGMYFSNKRDTPVSLKTSHEIVNAFNPNRLGFAYSKIANMEGILRSMHPGNEHYAETAAWIDFLAKKGWTIDKSAYPGIIGLGVEKGDFLAAYYPAGYLVREVNFHNKAKSMISKYGLTEREAVEAMKRLVLFHEFGHVVGVESEELQGLLEAEFSTTMADRHKGTKWERIYRALAQQGMDYAREHSLANNLDITSEDTSGRAIFSEYKQKFLIEAIMLGEPDVDSYVSRRMEDTFGALKGEPSYRASKTNSESSKPKREKSVSKRQGLEKLIKALEEEADTLGVDRVEYISSYLAKNPTEYLKEDSKAEKESPKEPETSETSASE